MTSMLFDLKHVSREQLLPELSKLERLYGKLRLTHLKDQILEAIPEARPPSDLQGTAQFGKVLDEAVADINLKTRLDRTMSVTGAKNLGQTLKDKVAQAKLKIEKANDAVSSASDNLTAAADHATGIAAQLQSEADDLMSSLGQVTNFPPEA